MARMTFGSGNANSSRRCSEWIKPLRRRIEGATILCEHWPPHRAFHEPRLFTPSSHADQSGRYPLTRNRIEQLVERIDLRHQTFVEPIDRTSKIAVQRIDRRIAVRVARLFPVDVLSENRIV